MKDKIIRQGLREITADEVVLIQDVVKRFPKLSRQEIAQTLCEHLSWHAPSGAPKVKNCLMLLERLADQELVLLPDKSARGRLTTDKSPSFTHRTDERLLIQCSLQEISPIELQLATNKQQTQLWNEYMERYHPLRYKRPFGNWLRYFMLADGEPLGCLLIGGAAKTIYYRDRWIGWDVSHRRHNLSWVINNSRYLIFPWVQIPHLASHALGQLVRRVAQDWETRWGYRPVLIETFVDPEQYAGICYQAAGWEKLGMTSGVGITRPGKHYSTSPKNIFVKPLHRHFRDLLSSQQLQGRIIE